ncbi:MAG: ZIP family metal transporter [Gammaproteobacteria bacterium]|nr:ZIP family metal transporter [Gammaproteobacteria bacterium]
MGPDAVHTAALWLVFGVVLMVFLLHVFHFHRHDLSGEATELYGAAAQASPMQSRPIHSGGLLGIGVGLVIHALVAGVALGASVRTDAAYHGAAPLAWLGVFLAIMAHKPLDAYSIVGMMRVAGHGPRARTVANVGFALVVPLTAIAAFSGVQLLGSSQEAVVGRALAFAAGAFLCISLSDLMPEIHFHSHDRGKLIGAFLVGIGLAYGLYQLESSLEG